MKKIVFVLLIMFVLICSKNINALPTGCTDDELARLNALVNQTKISENYLGNNKYSITITNIQPEFYVVDEYGLSYLYDSISESPSTITINPADYNINGYYATGNYTFTYYVSAGAICGGTKLTTKHKLLPWSNPFRDQIDCEKYSDFEYCKEYLYHDVTQNQFITKFEAYLKTKEETEKKETERNENKTAITDRLINFFLEYYYFILIPIIIGTTGGIYYLKMEEKKKNEL